MIRSHRRQIWCLSVVKSLPRFFAFDIGLRGRTDHGADLHALGDIAFIEDLLDVGRRQTDLVAIRGVALGRPLGDAALRQLVLQRFAEILRDVSAAATIGIWTASATCGTRAIVVCSPT